MTFIPTNHLKQSVEAKRLWFLRKYNKTQGKYVVLKPPNLRDGEFKKNQ